MTTENSTIDGIIVSKPGHGSDPNIKKYLTLIDLLGYSPKSLRLFNELHSASLGLLEESGQRYGLFGRQYTFTNEQEQMAISVRYAAGMIKDELYVAYIVNGTLKSFTLSRLRGNLTGKKIDRENLVDKMTRSSPLLKTLKELFQYEPHMLVINKGDNNRETIRY